MAKNIDMLMIMDVLNLEELAKSLTTNFIYNEETSTISPFVGFCIIMYIFALVAFVIRYVKGAEKTNGIVNIIITGAVAVLIIGMCISNRIYTLGSVVSDLANGMLYAVAGSLSEDGGGYAFTTKIDDDPNANKIIQLQEMSLVNKSFIKLQLCVQFGVSDASELDITALGDDANGTIASSTLVGLDGNSMKDDFNSNLGYYFWFANSSAKNKTTYNNVYPTTNTVASENKLNSMITYLQKLYNKAVAEGDTAKQNSIKHIILSFSNNQGGAGMLSMILFSIILVILMACLFRYALNVIIGKLELFISLLGLAIAGPLMLTNNKKLVQTSKVIMGMIVVSFINITVYSIIFDLILYFISSMISTNLLQLLVTLFLVVLLFKFNPLIQEKVKQILESTERSISPALADGKRAIKSYTRQKANDAMQNYNKSKKVVGHDEYGNAITQERGGNALSKLMNHGYNATYNDGMQRKGLITTNAESNKSRDANVKRSNVDKRRAAEATVDKVTTKINTAASRTKQMVESDQNKFVDKCQIKDVETGKVIGYNKDQLIEQEKTDVDKLETLLHEAEGFKQLGRYKQLNAEKLKLKENEKLPANLQTELTSYQSAIAAKQLQANAQRKLIEDSIKRRAQDDAFTRHGLDKSVEGATDSERLDNATKIKAQVEHKEELVESLQNAITTISTETNTRKTGKIGSTEKVVNKEAAESEAAAIHQLIQAKNDKIVDSRSDAKDKTKDIVKAVVNTNDRKYGSKEVEDALRKHDTANTIQDRDERKEAHKDARKDVRKAVTDNKKYVKAGKDNAKDAKTDTGRVATKATISEQLAAMINQREEELKAAAVNNTPHAKSTTASAKSPTNTTKSSTNTSAPIPTPMPTQSRTKADYENDEVKREANRQDDDFWNTRR